MNTRGATSLVGVVLLFGLVSIGAIVLLLSAGPMINTVSETTEQERVEQAMVELNTQMHVVTQHGETTRGTDIDLNEYGAVTRENTGSVVIESEGLDETIETTIGTVEWVGNDGTKIASEGGAVFRETGNETRLVSAPQFDYDHSTTTLNFPVVNVSGEEELGQGDITVSQLDASTRSESSIIENENVTVTVESEYCVGWQNYFVQEVGSGAVLEECSDDQTVVVRMGYFDVDESFDSGITFTDPDGFSTGGNPNVTDERRWGVRDDISDEIDQIVNQTVSNEDTVFLNETSDRDRQDGLYYTDDIEPGDQYSFTLTDGNATLVVDGDITAGEDAITVPSRTGDNVLKIYATGNFEADSGDVVYYDEPERQDASVIQLYGKDTMEIDFGPGGSPFYEGVIYAPARDGQWTDRCSSVQACFHSNPDFYGSIVVESIELQGGQGGLGFEYDEENLKDLDVDFFPEDGVYQLPPDLTYLNVAQHDIEIKSD